MKWIERTFSFEYPPSTFDQILVRVQTAPQRLEGLVNGLSHGALTRTESGSWSIQEHAGHLLDLESLEMQRLDDFEAGKEILTPADMTNQKTKDANHNSSSIESILTAFTNERSAFVKRLRSYDRAFLERTALHPRLQKKIRVIDLAFFIAEHDDHHLNRIRELSDWLAIS